MPNYFFLLADLRYYIKTQLSPEFIKIRIAAGENGKIDYTVSKPEINKWVWLKVEFKDFKNQNPNLKSDNIKVNALAVLVKFADADPAMPIYLGIDDVEFKGVQKPQLIFSQPEMYKLSEWESFIPKKHYQKNETFKLKGTWKINTDSVSLNIVSFNNPEKTIFSKGLKMNGNELETEYELNFPVGLYLNTLTAFKDGKIISSNKFTIYIKPDNIGKNHPRLWFNQDNKKEVIARLESARFKNVKEDILKKAKETREKNPVDSIFYDFEQFPGGDYDCIYSLYSSYFVRLVSWQDGVYFNSLAYSLLGDKQAGEYAKQLLIRISTFPTWTHPWWLDRGQHIYYPVAEMGMAFALGYNLLYESMTEEERATVRNGLTKQIVDACHKGYVEDNIVTDNTSNWVAHITGGSIMSQAAMYGDDEKNEVEPYFTGVILKTNTFIQNVFGKEGGEGESFGYYKFTMLSYSKALPALDKVFKIDLTKKITGSYKETIWASNIQKKNVCYYGDSRTDLVPLTDWAWLMGKNKDPLLGWFYNFMKKDETFMDVLYETKDVPMDDPFDENPVRFFDDIGTTVFKSGWKEDDFIFVMRTGAFYNHQHLDQGSFWLIDKGTTFISERKGSSYYTDPFYQPWYTQPVAHSTILINHNHQSQRVGDPLVFAEGFDDHAFIYNRLDGTDVAFSCGDIGKLYWGKVKEIRRNVLYIKPSTLLMLDEVIPNEKNVDVTLLYQSGYLEDIKPDNKNSTITKNGKVLNIAHLYPLNTEIMSVETPLYESTLINKKPLKKEGMLTITAKTETKPLIIANILTTTSGELPDITYQNNTGYISGLTSGKNFIFSTIPDAIYKTEIFTTDALTLSWDDNKTFAGLVKSLSKNGKLLLKSDIPLSCEISGNSIKYFLAGQADVIFGVEKEPSSMMINGKEIKDFVYDKKEGTIKISLPKGEGTIIIN